MPQRTIAPAQNDTQNNIFLGNIFLGMVTVPLPKSAQNGAQSSAQSSAQRRTQKNDGRAAEVNSATAYFADDSAGERSPIASAPSGSVLLDSFADTGAVEMDFAAIFNPNTHLQSNTLIAETIAKRARLQAAQRERSKPPKAERRAYAATQAIDKTKAIDQATVTGFDQANLDKTTLKTLETAISRAITQAAAAKEAAKSAKQAAKSESPDQLVTVYGGAQYKAMNAKAAAGGLVDLADKLLFGGADNSEAMLQDKASHDAMVLAYLTEQVSAFTIADIKTGIYSLAELNSTEPAQPLARAVLNANRFEVCEARRQLQTTAIHQSAVTGLRQLASPVTASRADGPSADDDLMSLSNQIGELYQKINSLSQKIATLSVKNPAKARLDQEIDEFSSICGSNQAVLDAALFRLNAPPAAGKGSTAVLSTSFADL
jgi:hypothetical protein